MILAWIVLSFAVGILATSKSIGFIGGFVISLCLSPLIGFVIYIISADKKPAEPTEIEKLRAEIEALKQK